MSRWELFDNAMRASAVDRLDIENALRRALDRRELRVFYQPVIDLLTGRVDGVEALLRWEHPERGLLNPGDFITVAEETGLIVPIGSWVLDQACRQVQRWHASAERNTPLSVAINISGRQLGHPRLVEDLAAVLADTSIDPSLVELEITESVLMDDVEMSADTLGRLHALGVHLAVDDFGTGYSSLSYLRRFPVDILKVDRSFVDGLGEDSERLGHRDRHHHAGAHARAPGRGRRRRVVAATGRAASPRLRPGPGLPHGPTGQRPRRRRAARRRPLLVDPPAPRSPPRPALAPHPELAWISRPTAGLPTQERLVSRSRDRAGDVRCWSAMATPLTRQTVIDAARGCIVADGLDAISLRKLAATLGVTAPALYAYVDDKRDLLRAVAEREFQRLSHAFEQIDDPDPVERMRQMSHAYVEQALAEPELFRTMFQFSPDLAMGATSGAEDALATAVFEQALGSVIEAIDSGALRAADPITVALTMWSATHGVADMLLMGFPFDDDTRQMLIDSVIDTVLAGLAAP